MTPAEVLAAAADKLDALIERAAPDWRIDAANFLAMPLIQTPFMIGPFKDDPEKRFGLVGPNDATTVYLWAMRPVVGKALAAWLRAEAKALDPKSVMVQRILTGDVLGVPVEHPLALARLILGDES